MDSFCANLQKSIFKFLLFSIAAYSCSATITFAAEDVFSTMNQTTNMKNVERCVAKINQYADDALGTASRLYQTSMCYFCVNCNLEADQGELFQKYIPRKYKYRSVSLNESFGTAYKLMQQAADLGDRKANYGLAVMIYAKGLNENKLTKELIAVKEFSKFKKKLETKEKFSEEEFEKSEKAIIKDVYSKRHELDFDAEIQIRLLNAARDGYIPAQFALGEIYSNGIGIAPNKVEAYAWAATAVAQNPPFGSDRRDDLAIRMDSFEINEAESLAEEYMKKYTDIFDRSSITVMR